MVRNVLALCAMLWAPVAVAATQVTEVAMRDGRVVIAADAPPNFTTFTMDNPPRLVVDLADATFVGVPADIAVGAEGVQGIKTMPYGSGANAVARIVITYDAPIQTDIVTDGNSIVVRPAGGGLAQTPPAQAAAMDDAMSALKSSSPPPSPPPAAAPPPTQQSAAAAPPPSPTPPPAPPEPKLAAPIPPSPRPAAREPAVAVVPPAPPPARHEAAAPPPPPAPPPAPPPEAVALNEAPPPPAAEEPPPAATPMAPAAPPPGAPPAPMAPQAAATAQAIPLKLNTQENLASPPPPPAPAPGEEPPHVTSRRKTLSLVGLRFNNGSMSVFVRTNEPVNYRVSERPTGLVVTIENTRIARRNDKRPLDAHFFDSPVANVRASQNHRDVEVNIELKTHVAYQATQSGREVQLNFNQS